MSWAIETTGYAEDTSQKPNHSMGNMDRQALGKRDMAYTQKERKMHTNVFRQSSNMLNVY